MPELSLTDEQLDRLRQVADDLEAAYVGPYGHVRLRDAVEYLLDTYTPPEEIEDTQGTRGATEADASDSTADDDEEETIGGDEDASPERTLKQAMDLLETHDDRWREGSSDEPYEVDLPDGSTEPARTKDDVKRLLFTHWQ